ncbi:hypothetical protein [Natronobacterium texcoconense]|uniref:SpoIIAA-like n=1 Tax=Natronobacterium texcoconense TaxID=1095778 RepID=A0A1H1J1N2_NATTX|nr:hypothetical protein [Natronobacterium texcoconense]SDR43813.1 hypothetical protein SAMN04489842_4011 [Natronobacterium texcoconense]
MATTDNVPNPEQYGWDFEKRGSVGVWFMKGWQGFADEDLEAASEHYRERGSKRDVEATLAVFGDATNLPKETQEYMGKEWSANGEYTGVEKIGFVSSGITAMAVKSQIDVDGATIESFDDLEEALEWART